MKIADAGIAWTGLYVASKVVFALEERLGVTGGPKVSPDGYLTYGPGEVASAQWANAGSGVLIMAILLAGRFRFRGRWTYRVTLAAHWLCTAVAAVGAAGMLGGAVLTDRGGAIFGAYCAVWAVLLCLATVDLRRRHRSVGR
ncbi:hypothetical protein SAMN05444920_114105 [Nonomuraea solani]|uniref:Uncharacterized protein n=1 Tax=Nonomuraea solani TaxID=1144553 RepID=A0A1H6ESM3_9ACTN|nr:hypothetical protein [Nonomuraea solani]SEG99829.1 hypothetical protein SAMN05444920_114105 [Nonomuraea solani]